MPKFEAHILSVMENGTHGHFSVSMRVIETLDDGTEILGVTETSGISRDALINLYGPDTEIDVMVERWLEREKQTIIDKHRRHGKVSDKLGAMVGKRY